MITWTSTVLIIHTLYITFHIYVFVEIIYWFGTRTTPRDTVSILYVSVCGRLLIILISMEKIQQRTEFDYHQCERSTWYGHCVHYFVHSKCKLH
jgi:hypothetical protein